ncbi:MAG: hypothetical protein WCL28_06025 [bacterium]
MNQPLIWLHEEALRTAHPVFKAAPQGTRTIFAWDDDYLQKSGYSLKRLVFIYETLCELPVDIIRGDTVSVIKELGPSQLYIPESHKPHIVSLINRLKLITTVEIINDDEFVKVPDTIDFKRFFKYWGLAEKNAFLRNGGVDA